MIRLICGPKGTGKTKTILDFVNASVDAAKGDIVFITDKKIDTLRVNFAVRVLYANDFCIDNSDSFRGFIDGLVAGNSDIEYLFIDGLTRIIGSDKGLEGFFKELIRLEKEYGFKATLTISKEAGDLPEFVRGFAE